MIALSLLLSTLAVAPPVTGAELEWFDGPLTAAVGQAAQDDGLVMVYFWRNGSERCTQMYQETLTNETAVKALGDMVCYSANYDDAAGGKLFGRFNVTTLPTVLFLKGGQPEDGVNGFIGADDFAYEIARIERGEGTLTGLKTAAASLEEGSDEIIEALFTLAGKHQDLGDQEAHDAVLATVRETHDPQSRTLSGSRAHLWKIQGEIAADIAACQCACEEGEEGEAGAKYEEGADHEGHDKQCAYEASVAKVDFVPLYAHAKAMKVSEARFEAWTSVANFEFNRADFDLAVKAYGRAAKDVPSAQLVSWPQTISWRLMGREDEATSKEKKLAVKLAEMCLDGADQVGNSASDGDGYGDGDGGGYGDPSAVQVRALGTLAFALNFSGNNRKAVKVAKQALELSDSAETAEWLKPIIEG